MTVIGRAVMAASASRFPPGRSLRARLSAWLAILSLIGQLALSVVVYVVTDRSIDARQAETLAGKRSQVEHAYREAWKGDSSEELYHRLDDLLGSHSDLKLGIRDLAGRIIYETPRTETEIAGSSPDRPPIRTLSFPMEVGGTHPATAELNLAVRADEMLLTGLGLTLAAAAVLGALTIALASTVLVKVGLGPLDTLRAQIQVLSAKTLDHRLGEDGQPSELLPLITQFNMLLERLQTAYGQLESFNADVAHELSTPITTMIAGAELAMRHPRSSAELREALGSNLELLQALALVVRDMLFLARADRGGARRHRTIQSLARIANDVAAFHEAAAEAAGVNLMISGEAEATCDVSLLQRALSNLMSNAIRHAHVGTAIRVDIRASPDQGHVTVIVSNLGEPVPKEVVARFFLRFFRAKGKQAEGAENHYGLGLAIVAAIARMHDGKAFAKSEAGLTTVGLTIRTRQSPSSLGRTLGDLI